MATGGLRYADAGDLTGMSFLDDTALRQYDPERILNLMLSTKSYLSTASTAAVENQKSHEEDHFKTFKQIGKGQCGVVWALLGTTYVLKVPNERKEDELWNDCRMHKRVEESFQQVKWEFRKDIDIPTFGAWIHPSNTMFWTDYSKYFPQGFQPICGLLSERIYPLPLPVRAAIVDAFAPRSVKANKVTLLAQPENKDCLIRLYLGRRAQRVSSNAFRLRNFDLMVNEMEHLRLDTMMYAKTMAQSLAILHWRARIDANDVEFVLGSAPKVKKPATAAEFDATSIDDAKFLGQTLDFHQRSIGIWLLDFNQCKTFSDDAAGVKQLERAFFFNDPYYPRPGMTDAKDKALWEFFKEIYLKTSAVFVESDMPSRFINAVESEGKKRSLGASMFQ